MRTVLAPVPAQKTNEMSESELSLSVLGPVQIWVVKQENFIRTEGCSPHANTPISVVDPCLAVTNVSVYRWSLVRVWNPQEQRMGRWVRQISYTAIFA